MRIEKRDEYVDTFISLRQSSDALSHAPLTKAYVQANQPESLERIESS